MKVILLAVVALAAASAAAAASKCQDSGQEAPAPPAMVLDPQTVDAAAIDDLHDAGREAICLVTPSSLDLLQLCRDKGFDGVMFESETAQLREQAQRLKLPVVGSEGRRTTTGS